MPHDFMPGLAGVPAAKSAISDVDGREEFLNTVASASRNSVSTRPSSKPVTCCCSADCRMPPS